MVDCKQTGLILMKSSQTVMIKINFVNSNQNQIPINKITNFSLTLYDPGGGGFKSPPSDFLLSRI